jgi:O-antigen ligase
MNTKQASIAKIIIAISTFGLLSFLLFFTSPTIIAAAAIFLAFLLVASVWPRLFFIILCVVYPFRYLQFKVEDYNYQVEYVTVLAVLILLAVLLNIYVLKRIKPKYELAFGITFICFLGANTLSLLNTPDLTASILFIVKPILLFYLAYLLLPINLIKNKNYLEKVLWAVFSCGLITAILGAISVIQQLLTGAGLTAIRAYPFAYGLFMPLGYNQNQIGEVLVASIPFTLILFLWRRISDPRVAKIALISTLFMTAVLLLTLSRAGWIALVIEIFVVFLAYKRSWAEKTIPLFVMIVIILIIIIPSSVIFYKFITGTEEVSNSNQVRLVLTEIALDNFYKYPFFGEGSGTYVESIYHNYKYLPYFRLELKFDAHGLFQKIISELGIVGLITFGVFAAAIGIYIKKAWKYIRFNRESTLIYSLAIAAIIGNAVYMAFNTSFYDAVTWLPIGLSIAIISWLNTINKKHAST